MKKFVPYHDGVLDRILPDDRLVPYQVGWAEYVAVPDQHGKRAGGSDERAVTPGAASAHHPAPGPIASTNRR